MVRGENPVPLNKGATMGDLYYVANENAARLNKVNASHDALIEWAKNTGH